ncbi:MAG TPA: 4-(cytidine 5'-diphospho)-2-C-methyl-D-erythritol kinase [Candidatus Dormibacteraeota bacterium]|nr:4-(cytidine 5'-diphospho)-2-C-methyl-D-erythritol kinase [Candidatus Dormibacteraeota bacterium]
MTPHPPAGHADVAAVAVPAHAKLNLDLAVLGRRPDGHHEIRTRFQAISLHDLLIVETAALTHLEGGVPDDLVLRAQRALAEAAGRDLPARLRLVKRIPIGAGLGGGSADAAAALRGLSRVYGLRCDLAPIAAGLGADVPFLVYGGSAIGTGLGERLQPVAPDTGWYAVVWPGFPVSTGDVYRRWDEVGGAGPNQLRRAAFAVEPRLAEFADMLGPGWHLTGSGAAFFRRCRTRAEAESAVRAGASAGWTAVARPLGPWSRPG